MKGSKKQKDRAAAKLALQEKLKKYQQMALEVYRERMKAEDKQIAERKAEKGQEGWQFFWDDEF